MYNQNELYHHGILGMKWGKRNGPPYPLSGAQKSAAEKKQSRGKQSAGDMSDSELQNYIKRKNLEKQYNKLSRNDEKPSRLEKTKKVVDETSNALNRVKNLNRELTNTTQTKEKLDLSNMTDNELRARVNRANLERQYTNLFANDTPTVNKGQAYASKILDVGGDVLAIGSSALAIALAVKELRGK